MMDCPNIVNNMIDSLEFVPSLQLSLDDNEYCLCRSHTLDRFRREFADRIDFGLAYWLKDRFLLSKEGKIKKEIFSDHFSFEILN